MHTSIKAGSLLSEDQTRQVDAALKLKGLDRKSYAAREGVSYQRLNRMLGRSEVPSASYAARLDELVESAFRPFRRAAA